MARVARFDMAFGSVGAAEFEISYIGYAPCAKRSTETHEGKCQHPRSVLTPTSSHFSGKRIAIRCAARLICGTMQTSSLVLPLSPSG